MVKHIYTSMIVVINFMLMSSDAIAGLSTKYLIKQAESGDVLSQLLLAEHYMEDTDGKKRDYSKAAYWLEQAALLGDAEAQYRLASLLESGKGVKQDITRACKYYEKAANQNYVKAQLEVAKCYSAGKGMSVDESRAREWYQKAAKSGDKQASRFLKNDRFYNQVLRPLNTAPRKLKDISNAMSFKQSRRYRLLSSEQKNQLKTLEKQYIQRYAIPLLLELIAVQQGLDGYDTLLGFPSHYNTIISKLAMSSQNKLAMEVESKKSELQQLIIEKYRLAYDTEVVENRRLIDALEASVQFERRASSAFQDLYLLEAFNDLRTTRAQHRHQLYQKLNKTLTKEVRELSYFHELEAFTSKYVWHSKETSSGQLSINRAVTEKRAEIMPFSNLAASDYFNAIYSGNWKKAKEIDYNFIYPYLKNMGQTLSAMGALIDGFSALGGNRTNYREDIINELKAASLISPLFSIYLLDYPFMFKTCMDTKPVQFKKTTTSETVYRNGYGAYQYSVKHPDKVEYFLVNHRFAQIFKKVGLGDSDDGAAQLLDTFFSGNNASRITISDIQSSSRKFMKTYQCNSPIVKRMENQMEHYFYNYKKL
ncbi:tetratricopeptide repeat protein [Pseudoalteromonas rubra]|uniref:tetratricopeptide repeat protein n=1 Tax=Pseudoalteromonas rubra TaxID=43658 RepID=UPI000697EE57|nr:tetratricopeptide repeat protein [Pseudoalteromonas rubra]